MSPKIVTTSLGLLAVGALVLVNATYASGSDRDPLVGDTVSVTSLQLSVTRPGTQRFDAVNMLPGGAVAFESFITSRDQGGVPSADLALRIEQLVDTEDGCTTSSEAAADDCETNLVGDFSGTGYLTVETSLPTSDPAACDSTEHPRRSVLPTAVHSLQDLSDLGSLSLLRDGFLKPGEGICVALALGLPPSAGNALQGDSVSFDVEFDLSEPAIEVLGAQLDPAESPPAPGRHLPTTGNDPMEGVVLGSVALGIGGLFLVLTRRRRRTGS